jgi:hypothetical protein
VEARLVKEPWEYPWSSARAYAPGVPDPLLAENPWYLELEPAVRQRRGRGFLVGEDPREKAFRRSDWAVGDEDFRRRLQARPPRAPKTRPAGQAEGRKRIILHNFIGHKDVRRLSLISGSALARFIIALWRACRKATQFGRLLPSRPAAQAGEPRNHLVGYHS